MLGVRACTCKHACANGDVAGARFMFMMIREIEDQLGRLDASEASARDDATQVLCVCVCLCARVSACACACA